jgi:putative DNA-invertase from lambdoid prophage Rac
VPTRALSRRNRKHFKYLDTLAAALAKRLEELKRQRVALHLIDLGGDVTGDGISRLVFTILTAVAEAERHRIAERIKDIKADQRQCGRFLGGATPFGYRKTGDGGLIPEPSKQRAIKPMKELRQAGKSLRAIAKIMRSKRFQMSHAAARNCLKPRWDESSLTPISFHEPLRAGEK